MKYETPELTFLTPAIDAVQGTTNKDSKTGDGDHKENASAYEDWE